MRPGKKHLTLMASMAYSTWNKRPSGEKVFTPRSYSLLTTAHCQCHPVSRPAPPGCKICSSPCLRAGPVNGMLVRSRSNSTHRSRGKRHASPATRVCAAALQCRPPPSCCGAEPRSRPPRSHRRRRRALRIRGCSTPLRAGCPRCGGRAVRTWSGTWWAVLRSSQRHSWVAQPRELLHSTAAFARFRDRSPRALTPYQSGTKGRMRGSEMGWFRRV